MLGEVKGGGEDGWLKGWMYGQRWWWGGEQTEEGGCSLFSRQPPSPPSTLPDVLVPSYVICLGEM